MTRFVADLHVNSRSQSSANSDLSFAEMAEWAKLKGLQLLGTGDFLHPARLGEMREQLIVCEDGLLALSEDSDVRFLPTAEISGLVKVTKGTGKVRLLVAVPGLAAAEKVARRLEPHLSFSNSIPAAALSAAELAARILELEPDALLIPADIFNPEDCLFSSSIGCNSLEDAFGPLAPRILALETGLSAEPSHCWRSSQLNGRALVSFSEASSARDLGREATIFSAAFSYPGLLGALKGTGNNRIAGTLEHCSELGRHYFNGHRSCHIVKSPVETGLEGRLCPRCRKEITLGTLHRSQQLADRSIEDLALVQDSGWIFSRRLQRPPYHKIIPLREIIAATLAIKSPKSLTVERTYRDILACGLTELDILLEVEEIHLKAIAAPQIVEALRRVRENRYRIMPGYDGAEGRLQVFDDLELAQMVQLPLFQ